LIHCSLWGPYRHVSSYGASYLLTSTIDDYSRAVSIYLLIDKKEVSKTMQIFFFMVKHQFNKHVKIIRIDNGIELTCLKNYFVEHSIVFKHLVQVHHNKLGGWNININIY